MRRYIAPGLCRTRTAVDGTVRWRSASQVAAAHKALESIARFAPTTLAP